MNQNLLETSIIQLAGSLLLGFLTLYLIARIFSGKLGSKYFPNEHPLSQILILSSGLLASGFLLSICVQPVINVSRILRSQNLEASELYLSTARFTGLFIFVALATFFVILVLANFLNKVIDKGIKIKEHHRDQILPQVIFPVLIIVFSLLVKDSMLLIIESFIPYPSIPIFNQL